MPAHRSRYHFTKRSFDIALAAAGLAVTAPILVITAAAVRLKLGRPVIFKQERIGKGGQPFTLYKFRTMLPVDHSKNQVTNAQRITTFGTLLRSTSLDELPGLVNVLRGDMSLVGPRPLRSDYKPRYSRHHARRHEVRPGITGLAQVVGRNSLGWNERLDLDVHYVEHISPRLDLEILLRTFSTVVLRRGVREEGQATASEFMGSGPTLDVRLVSNRDKEQLTEWTNGTACAATSLGSGENLDSESGRHYLCSTPDGAAVAVFSLTECQAHAHHKAPTTAMASILTNPRLRHRGFGRLAMVRLIKTARQHGLETLCAVLHADDEASRRLFERFGFIETSHDADGMITATLRISA